MTTATEVFADQNRTVERTMSIKELADIAEMHATALQAKEDAKASAADKAIAKAALLERLGITADEAALLLS